MIICEPRRYFSVGSYRSFIFEPTSFPVGICLASLTLAKFPFPIVLSNRYFPICGSSPVRLDDTRADDPPSPLWNVEKISNVY